MHNTHEYQDNNPGYGCGRGTGRGYGSNRPQCQLCGKFGHLVHRCFQRLNVHFQGVTAQSSHEISTKLSHVQ